MTALTINGSIPRVETAIWPPPDPRQAPFRRYQDNVFMDKEGEAHARIRSLVTKVFTPKRVESLRGVLEQTTHKLIDAVEAKGECDFVRDIAEPLPVIMIADLLGIPEELRGNLRSWSNAIVKMYELGFTDQQVYEANKAATDFSALIRGWDWLILRFFRTWSTRTTGKFHGQSKKNGCRCISDDLRA